MSKPAARQSLTEPEPEYANTPWPTGEAPNDPAEAAQYIAQLTGELAGMAAAAHLDTLAYLLAMARVEAEIAARAGGYPTA
ncbi:MAG: hypothetical protein JWN93_1228 [Hyphomicrobiales bacterium]|nr:hypothetical protein [Hyphomicrobiales bacterium]